MLFSEKKLSDTSTVSDNYRHVKLFNIFFLHFAMIGLISY